MRFLKEAEIQIGISPLNEDNLQRVYELAQRTNQLNFSGNRYPQEQLRELLAAKSFETYVISCGDKFGSYGIVGFAVVDICEPRLLDLMFSCRVQGKRVEHAVLSLLLRRFVQGTKQDFYANYRKTERNTPAGRVFDEMGFECVGKQNGVLSLAFRNTIMIPDDGIILILESDWHESNESKGT
jgi:FkbH-like protein